MSEKVYSGASRVTDVELEKAIKKNRRKNWSRIACILFVCFFFFIWWLPGRWPIIIITGGSGGGVGTIIHLIHFVE